LLDESTATAVRDDREAEAPEMLTGNPPPAIVEIVYEVWPMAENEIVVRSSKHRSNICRMILSTGNEPRKKFTLQRRVNPDVLASSLCHFVRFSHFHIKAPVSQQ
jgi:hypothetical protein